MQTIVRRREEGDIWRLCSSVETKVTTAQTDGRYAITEQVVTPASSPPVHVHDEPEAIYVLNGEVVLEVDGATTIAGPGTFAFVPAGAAHTYRVRYGTARMLVVTS